MPRCWVSLPAILEILGYNSRQPAQQNRPQEQLPAANLKVHHRVTWGLKSISENAVRPTTYLKSKVTSVHKTSCSTINTQDPEHLRENEAKLSVSKQEVN